MEPLRQFCCDLAGDSLLAGSDEAQQRGSGCYLEQKSCPFEESCPFGWRCLVGQHPADGAGDAQLCLPIDAQCDVRCGDSGCCARRYKPVCLNGCYVDGEHYGDPVCVEHGNLHRVGVLGYAPSGVNRHALQRDGRYENGACDGDAG